MTLRITAGKWSRKCVRASPGRPTSSVVREALCNMISMENSCGLDLFAGSGIISFEALSRGANSVVLVEKCSKALSAIRTNAASLDCQSSIKLLPFDAAIALRRLQKKELRFDWIFADPPYHDFSIQSFIQPGFIECMGNLLKSGGSLVIEHSERVDVPCDFWKGKKTLKKYGETRLTILSQS